MWAMIGLIALGAIAFMLLFTYALHLDGYTPTHITRTVIERHHRALAACRAPRTQHPNLLDPALVLSPYLTPELLTPEQLDQRTHLIQRAKARKVTHAQEPTVPPDVQLKVKQLEQAKQTFGTGWDTPSGTASV